MLPLILAAAGVGFTAVLVGALAKRSVRRVMGRMISYEPPTPARPAVTSSKSSGYVSTITLPKQFTPDIVTSVLKWARVRGVPPQELLATIYVESRGNPRAWANKANEDSRGLMQINIRAWGPKLKQYGLTVDDLWDVDKNIMIGSLIYKKYRDDVLNWIAQSGVPQATPVDVLTRLAYKGPAYVRKKILAGEDASHPYRNAEAAIDNWKVAMALADKVTSVV
jgi:hypothetical protein